MLRVAILDNSAIARGLLRTILADGGQTVISEGGVASTNLSRPALLAPQLVFIALDPENDDADSTLKSLRDSLPRALIFAVSSELTTGMIKKAGEHGANGFIVKPFNGATVRSSIHNTIFKLVERQKAETER